MFVALFLSLFLMTGGEATESYILVLTNQKTMKVAEPPVIKDNRCVVTLLSGEKTSIPLKLVDQEQTISYNRRMAEVREATKRAAALAEAEKEAAAGKLAAAEPAEPKNIVLKRTKDLPEYDRSSNRIEGLDDGTGQDAPLAPPEVHSYNSSDPVFLSRETIHRLASSYRIECDLAVNAPTGAKNVRLKIKVNFENAPAQELEAVASPADIDYGKIGKVVFELPTSDVILRTSYEVSGDIAVSQ